MGLIPVLRTNVSLILYEIILDMKGLEKRLNELKIISQTKVVGFRGNSFRISKT
jgi:hypothetical protein